MANKLSITHGPNLKKPCFLVSGGEERVSIQYYRPEKAAGSLTQCSFEEAKQLHETLGGPKWIKPQLTRLVDEAPAGGGWLHGLLPAEMSFPRDVATTASAQR